MIAAMPHIRKSIPLPLHRRKPFKPSKTQQHALDAYREAYKAVYGILPGVSFDGVWCTLRGQPQRVRLRRLRELTTQLRNRASL
jgi:hypothetical protein